MKAEKDKSDDSQYLISKDVDKKRLWISHKVQMGPSLQLVSSLKLESRGYKSNFKLNYQTQRWKTSASICPESGKTDFSLSRRIYKGQVEVGVSQTSLELAYMRQMGSWQVSAGALCTNRGVTPMLKVSQAVAGHKLSLACGYGSGHVDYYVNYSKGPTRFGVPFRVNLERYEGITLSLFLMGCVYIVSHAFYKEERKPRRERTTDIVIFLAISGPFEDIIEGKGEDVSSTLRLLAMGRTQPLPLSALSEQLQLEPDWLLRLDYRYNKLDYCSLYSAEDTLSFEDLTPSP